MAGTPLRRELLNTFGLLFTGAILIAALGLTVVLPVLESPAEGVLFIVVLIVADLVVLFLFGGAYLQRKLVAPMERLADDARRIADGDFLHRGEAFASLELDQLRESMSAMADRLLQDQARLAKNVESLDLTNQELVRVRDEVVQSARLASVGTLASGIAHEVGNPLGAILAYVDVTKSRIGQQGAAIEMLDSIRDEALRIDRIVRGLLDYARPRQSPAGPESPARVMERVRELLDTQGKLDRVRDRWSADSEVPDVLMEAQQLEQVLVNLLLNALDALEGTEDPEVTVTLTSEPGDAARFPRRRAGDPPGINYMHRRRVALDDRGLVNALLNAERVVVITVADNGPGIPDEHMDSVFDPFFTTKELGKGTGLGLSICARLVEGMGGRIQAASRPSGGATFTVRLPAAGPAAQPIPRAEQEAVSEAREAS